MGVKADTTVWRTMVPLIAGLLAAWPTGYAQAAETGADAATRNFVWSLMTDSQPGELRYCRDLPLIGLTCHRIRQVQAGSFGFLHLDIGDEPDEKRNFRRRADGTMIDTMPYAPDMQARLTPLGPNGIVKRDKQQYRLTLAMEITWQAGTKPDRTRKTVRTRTIEWTIPERNLGRLRQIRDLAQRLQANEVAKRLDYLLE